MQEKHGSSQLDTKFFGGLLVAVLAVVLVAAYGYVRYNQPNQTDEIVSPSPSPETTSPTQESPPASSSSEESTQSASIPNPSVPEFTVSFVDNSYDVPSTYGIDPYTGETVITQNGYHVAKRSIQFTIKNQPFSPYDDSNGNYIGLYYNLRYKGYYGNDWSYYPFNPTGVSSHTYGGIDFTELVPLSASNSETAVISIDLITLSLPSKGQVDFQVQAEIGHIVDMSSSAFARRVYGAHYDFIGESSAWSETQSITLSQH